MGAGVDWFTTPLTLEAGTGTGNGWAAAVLTRGAGTGAETDRASAGLEGPTGPQPLSPEELIRVLGLAEPQLAWEQGQESWMQAQIKQSFEVSHEQFQWI